MPGVLAGAVKLAAKKGVAKTAARTAARSAMRNGATKAAARATANRVATTEFAKGAGEIAAYRIAGNAAQVAAKPVESALGQTINIAVESVMKGLAGTALVVLTVGGVAVGGYSRLDDDGLKLFPWAMDMLGVSLPGLSLPGFQLPSFGGGGSAESNQIAATAMEWVGKDFAPGAREQCAYFVRHVLNEAGLNVGVTRQPIDGYATSEGFANSFYGKDLGQIINDPSALQSGDIVMFLNTYGDYPAGTVTHVGIYVGDGMMVDRPTASRPVQHRPISMFKFAGALRIVQASEASAEPNAIYKGLKRRGMSPIMAAAFVGNIGQESNFDPAVENGIGAFGLVQWLDGRRARLEAFASSKGQPASDVDVQLDFIFHELHGTESAAYQSIRLAEATGSLEATVKAVAVHYERMGAHEIALENRIAYARSVYR